MKVKLYATLRGRRRGTRDYWGPVAYEGDVIELTGVQWHAGQHGREAIEIAILPDGQEYEINANEVPAWDVEV